MSEAEHASEGMGLPSSADGVSAVKAGLFAACSWLLALGGILGAQLAHQGLHEHIELPPLLHWLRDAAVAVPMAALAVGLAWLVVGRGTDRGRGVLRGALAAWLAWAALATLLFAAFSIPGNQLHGLLFGAEEEAGISWLEDALLDSGIVLLWSLIVLIPAALAGSVLWPAQPRSSRPQVSARPAPIAPSAGLSALPATTGTTFVGGDR